MSRRAAPLSAYACRWWAPTTPMLKTSSHCLRCFVDGRTCLAPTGPDGGGPPGYAFRALDALLTNFHLPRSSLLVLVAALAGRELILKSYGHAVRAGYRFYSYGDATLIL